MITRKWSVAAPGVILVACEVLVQWHGWPFWRRYFDPWAGPGVSVVLGILAAALWWQAARKGRGPSAWVRRVATGALALVATLVLLAGPLYQVGAPVLAGRQTAEIRAQQIERLEAQLATYRANSERRAGWLPAMERAQADLLALEGQAARAALPWQTWAVVALQTLALILLQTGAAIMAGTASRIWQGTEHPAGKEEHVPVSSQEPKAVIEAVTGYAPTAQASVTGYGISPEPPVTPQVTNLPAEPVIPSDENNRLSPDNNNRLPELIIKRLQREIQNRMTAENLSANEFCKRHQVNKRYLWLLLNHFKHARSGKETISPQKLTELAGRFLSQAEQGRG